MPREINVQQVAVVMADSRPTMEGDRSGFVHWCMRHSVEMEVAGVVSLAPEQLQSKQNETTGR
jgi:hypothetical protein